MLTPLAGGIKSEVTLTGDTDHPPARGGVWGKAPDTALHAHQRINRHKYQRQLLSLPSKGSSSSLVIAYNSLSFMF